MSSRMDKEAAGWHDASKVQSWQGKVKEVVNTSKKTRNADIYASLTLVQMLSWRLGGVGVLSRYRE